MKYLSRLTPAETLIILTGDKTPLSELLKYTFMDLLLKQVLAIREVHRQASSRDPIRAHKYVVIGKNFKSYQVRTHEPTLLSIFQTNPEANVLFRNLVKIAYQNAKSERYYYPKLTTSPNLKEAISTSLLQKVLGRFSYTQKGAVIKKEIQNEMSSIERTVSDYIVTDRNRGLELLKAIGGNIFLLKTLEFEILKEFDKELFEEMTKRNTGPGCSGGCWTDFGHYSESFDRSCSSDRGTSCSGDSGCSGCSSGCSGCGGGGD
ncbi:MAG TPA: hypothetical protein VD927_05865 [Chryseosolibacter sp.]|nr:hypothetical protein [Chryseosolibacter sp.]